MRVTQVASLDTVANVQTEKIFDDCSHAESVYFAAANANWADERVHLAAGRGVLDEPTHRVLLLKYLLIDPRVRPAMAVCCLTGAWFTSFFSSASLRIVVSQVLE